MAPSSERSLTLDDPQASTSSSEWLIENTVETLGRMMIGCCDFTKKNEEKVAKEEEEKQKEIPSTSKQNKPDENSKTRNILRLSRIRWAPYVVPQEAQGEDEDTGGGCGRVGEGQMGLRRGRRIHEFLVTR